MRPRCLCPIIRRSDGLLHNDPDRRHAWHSLNLLGNAALAAAALAAAAPALTTAAAFAAAAFAAAALAAAALAAATALAATATATAGALAAVGARTLPSLPSAARHGLVRSTGCGFYSYSGFYSYKGSCTE